jgi:hypothetical protein
MASWYNTVSAVMARCYVRIVLNRDGTRIESKEWRSGEVEKGGERVDE